jgi:hypothetical protein
VSADSDSLDALASSLQTLSEALQQTIDDLNSSNDLGRAQQVTDAQNKIDAAAKKINNASALIKLSNAAFSKLQLLTAEINGKADQIAQEEQNVARIVGIASGVVTLASDIASANIEGAISAANDITSILD